MGIIYKCVNLKNNKVYIGQTTRELEQRKKEHINHSKDLTKSKYFQNALKRNGYSNFSWEILENIDDNNLLNDKEIFWINYFKSNLREQGYNLTSGGKAGKPNLETRKKIALSKLGEKNNNFKKVPEQIIEDMRAKAGIFSLTEIKKQILKKYGYVISQQKISKIFKERNIVYSEDDYRSYWKNIKIQRKVNEAELCRLRREGKTISYLEKFFKISRQTVNKVLNKNNINVIITSRADKNYKNNRQNILDLFYSGWSISKIAKKFNFNTMTLCTKLKKEGVYK